MTDKELYKAQSALNKECRDNSYGYVVNGRRVKTPRKVEREQALLSCISMINSLLAYGYRAPTAQIVYDNIIKNNNTYLDEYIRKFGKKKVIQLIQGQLDDLVDINVNVYIDGEGCSYNSLTWRDDI